MMKTGSCQARPVFLLQAAGRFLQLRIINELHVLKRREAPGYPSIKEFWYNGSSSENLVKVIESAVISS